MDILKDVINNIHSGGKVANGNDGIDIKINKTPHQKGNSECGVYSLNFIIRMLDGESFNDISKNRIDDSQINKFREVYFTKKN